MSATPVLSTPADTGLHGRQIIDDEAARLSVNCFFNALLRETDLASWHDAGSKVPAAIQAPAVCITLPSSDTRLWLGVRYRSRCGRHQFRLPIVRSLAQGAAEPIDLTQAASEVAAEARIFPQAEPAGRAQFLERVRMSERNLALAIDARRDDLSALFSAPLSFVQAEQGLLVGHSIHPTPKSREPFSDRDAQRYAPEFAQAFALHWIGVRPQQLHGRSSLPHTTSALMQALAQRDGVRAPDSAEHVAVPMHPWQWQFLQADQRIQALRQSGDIISLGCGLPGWRATSSLRAVYAAHSPWMLKFSLSLRLTNSLRTLQPQEMARGLEVSRIRETPLGQAFSRRYPHFQVLAEPAYLMLNDGAGNALPQTLVMLRENPFRAATAENVCLLASLTQDHPGGAPCRAAQLVRQYAARQQISLISAAQHWFERFLDAVIEPLLIAQADYGWLYGAHQQNLVIDFDQELPCGGWFRDCQGSGFSQLGAQLLAPWLPQLGQDTANVIDDDMANRLFVYYLIVNSCFGLISALASDDLVDEDGLLAILRQRLIDLRQGPRRDRGCLNYLLDHSHLWAKGNFQCALIGLNETTSEDPLAIYHRLANPLQTTEPLS